MKHVEKNLGLTSEDIKKLTADLNDASEQALFLKDVSQSSIDLSVEHSKVTRDSDENDHTVPESSHRNCVDGDDPMLAASQVQITVSVNNDNEDVSEHGAKSANICKPMQFDDVEKAENVEPQPSRGRVLSCALCCTPRQEVVNPDSSSQVVADSEVD